MPGQIIFGRFHSEEATDYWFDLPEKLSFDKSKGGPGRNEAVRLIYTLGKGFSEIKKPDSSQKLAEPGEVTPLGLEPRTQRLRVFCSTN